MNVPIFAVPLPIDFGSLTWFGVVAFATALVPLWVAAREVFGLYTSVAAPQIRLIKDSGALRKQAA